MILLFMRWQLRIDCAKRSFHPVVKKNWCPSLLTRIIDFCERHLEGVTRLLDLGGLSLGFWVIRKWIAVNVVNEWEQSVQGPSLDHGFCVFCETFEKHVGWFTSIPCPGADYIELFLKCDVRLRMRENVGSDLFESTAGWKEVLRAPAAHGVSSYK